MAFFKSKGNGQFFKRTGDRVVIVCKYSFNPSIKVTSYDDKLFAALECKPCSRSEFFDAYAEVKAISESFIVDMAVAA